jgi:hypothetical protein
MKQDRNLRECTGIPGRVNTHGLNMSPEGSTDLLHRFNFIDGHFCHKECCGIFKPESLDDDTSCVNCISASYTIRSDRTPYLFVEPSPVTEIAQSAARIMSAIQNAANKFKSMDSFGDSEPAKQFASYLMVHEINSLDFIHNSISYNMSQCVECCTCIIHSSSSDSSGGQKNKRKIDDESGTTCDDWKKKIRNTK